MAVPKWAEVQTNLDLLIGLLSSPRPQVAAFHMRGLAEVPALPGPALAETAWGEGEGEEDMTDAFSSPGL